jgi:hypothetical protein
MNSLRNLRGGPVALRDAGELRDDRWVANDDADLAIGVEADTGEVLRANEGALGIHQDQFRMHVTLPTTEAEGILGVRPSYVPGVRRNYCAAGEARGADTSPAQAGNDLGAWRHGRQGTGY